MLLESLFREVLDKRFILREEVGLHSWKSSRVFKAKDKEQNREVCLKIAEEDPESHQDRSFVREYNILNDLINQIWKEKEQGRTDLPMIPEPYGHGTVNFEGSQLHYLTRDFIKGIMWFRYFEDKQFKSIDERAICAIDDVISASKIVTYLHEKGMYNRDLKPYDFVKNKYGVHLIDFEALFPEGSWGEDNSPLFSAPEVTNNLSKNKPGHLSDIYSLGQIVFALVVSENKIAYMEFINNIYGLNKQELNDKYHLGINSKLINTVTKATHYNPEYRYQSVAELNHILKEIKHNLVQE